MPPFLNCPACKEGFTLRDDLTLAYFRNENIGCGKCRQPMDWWKLILNTIQENFMSTFAYMAIGAKSLAMNIALVPHRKTIIRFADYGLPCDAKILQIQYTSIGSAHNCLFPLEVHGNSPIRHIIPNIIALYPISLEDDSYPQTGNEASIFVTWVAHTPDDELWEYLVTAFEAFAQNRFNAILIPSNIAVESKLTRLIAQFFEKFANKDSVKKFLSEGAVYSYQLNVLLPMIISLKGLPNLQDHIRGHLNRLRKLRNQLAHDGKLKEPLAKNEAAEMLCAALFGFRYLKFISDELFAPSTEQEKLPAAQ